MRREVIGLGFLGATDEPPSDPGSFPEPEVAPGGPNTYVVGDDPGASGGGADSPGILDIVEGTLSDPFAIDKDIWGWLTGGGGASSPRGASGSSGSSGRVTPRGGGGLLGGGGGLLGGGGDGAWSPVVVAGGVAAIVVGGAWLFARGKRKRGRR